MNSSGMRSRVISTCSVPQRELNHLVFNMDIVHVIFKHCRFTECAMLGKRRPWGIMRRTGEEVMPIKMDAQLYLGKPAASEHVQQTRLAAGAISKDYELALNWFPAPERATAGAR